MRGTNERARKSAEVARARTTTDVWLVRRRNVAVAASCGLGRASAAAGGWEAGDGGSRVRRCPWAAAAAAAVFYSSSPPRYRSPDRPLPPQHHHCADSAAIYPPPPSPPDLKQTGRTEPPRRHVLTRGETVRPAVFSVALVFSPIFIHSCRPAVAPLPRLSPPPLPSPPPPGDRSHAL